MNRLAKELFMRKVFMSIAAVIFLFTFIVYASPKQILFINQTTCAKCGTCQKVCQMKAISKIEKDGKTSFVVDPKKCIGCETCVKICPTKSPKLISVSTAEPSKTSSASKDSSTASLKKPAIETTQSTSTKSAK